MYIYIHNLYFTFAFDNNLRAIFKQNLKLDSFGLKSFFTYLKITGFLTDAKFIEILIV